MGIENSNLENDIEEIKSSIAERDRKSSVVERHGNFWMAGVVFLYFLVLGQLILNDGFKFDSLISFIQSSLMYD